MLVKALLIMTLLKTFITVVLLITDALVTYKRLYCYKYNLASRIAREEGELCSLTSKVVIQYK